MKSLTKKQLLIEEGVILSHGLRMQFMVGAVWLRTPGGLVILCPLSGSNGKWPLPGAHFRLWFRTRSWSPWTHPEVGFMSLWILARQAGNKDYLPKTAEHRERTRTVHCELSPDQQVGEQMSSSQKMNSKGQFSSWKKQNSGGRHGWISVSLRAASITEKVRPYFSNQPNQPTQNNNDNNNKNTAPTQWLAVDRAPFPRTLKPSSHLHLCTQVVHIHMCTQNTHTHEIKLNKTKYFSKVFKPLQC